MKLVSEEIRLACREARQRGYFKNTPMITVEDAIPELRKPVRVHYKLECDQPSGSFKDRGLSTLIAAAQHKQQLTKIISSSGGNAGFSAATIGQKMGVPVEVYCPVTTPVFMRDLIRSTGSKVIVHGANWNEADALARTELNSNPYALYVPPFDHPCIWEGHSSLIDELVDDFKDRKRPDVIVASVGGGGLLRGIQIGLERHGWDKSVSVLAAETIGAASFARAKSLGFVDSIGEIKTIATSLGALMVVPSLLTSVVNTISVVVTDRDAAKHSIAFLKTHRRLVEAACGTALATLDHSVAKSWISDHIFWKDLIGTETGIADEPLDVVVIVCGGSVVTGEAITKWKLDFKL